MSTQVLMRATALVDAPPANDVKQRDINREKYSPG